MIPPSVVLVIYGLTVNVSIGELFSAAVLPGLMMAGMYIAYILIRCHINPALGPPAPDEERNIPFAEKVAMLKSIALPMLIAASVLGTIYTGVASVTEAAGMGVVGTAIAAALRRELSWAMIQDVLIQTMVACGILLWVSFGATAMIGVYNLAGGPAFIRKLMIGLPVAPIVIIFIMMAILFILGCLRTGSASCC
jgi:TRAP-type mannitol/chloroaromatic compound transport system permease large subunit